MTNSIDISIYYTMGLTSYFKRLNFYTLLHFDEKSQKILTLKYQTETSDKTEKAFSLKGCKKDTKSYGVLALRNIVVSSLK